MQQVAEKHPFAGSAVTYPVSCLNIGHDFFEVPVPDPKNVKPHEMRIVCRKCGEVRKVD